MYHIEIPFADVPHFNFKDKFYQAQIKEIKDFISYTPELDTIKEATKGRKNKDVDRDLLYNFLVEEYSKTYTSPQQNFNIERIKESNTFTIATAHQPCLFGGPAYYFYKIFSTIHLAESLNKAHPECYFIPVFVNGGEDHDFEEVNHLNLYGKKVEWTTQQRGSVGRFSLEGLDTALEQLKDVVGNSESGLEFVTLLSHALAQSKDYNEFVFRWVNAYFNKWGLLVVSMDDKRLKAAFRPYMKKEIFQMPSQSLVEETQNKLAAFGFKPQAHAREINIFYLGDGFRERIVNEDGVFMINNTDLTFSKEEMEEELEKFPEKFSPNVVMRPLFQEIILPNIAFVCGGGEVSYWIERKTQFDHFGVFFPMVIRRNSIMFVNEKQSESIEKIGLKVEDFVYSETDVIQKFLDENTSTDIHLEKYKIQIQTIIQEIQDLSVNVDKTLEGFVGKEGHNIIKTIENIESKLLKALKNKESVHLNKLSNLYAKLHPEGKLQERHEHFMQFVMHAQHNPSDYLITICNPLKKDFLLVVA